MSGRDASGDLAVSVSNVSKVYDAGGRDIRALDDVSIDVWSGSVTGILGPNGAGKTTLIKCILGLIEPTEGTVHVNGYDLHEHTRKVHRHVAAVLEGSRNIYWRLSVLENMRFLSAVSGNDPTQRRDFHEELLNRFGLDHKRETAVRELSRGQKQKASIVCALAREPEVLFLDEPTLGLDVMSSHDLRAELGRMATELGHSIVVTSHDMDVIEDICDEVIILIDGQVEVSDTVEALLDRFGVQTYEMTVSESLSESQKRRLGEAVDARAFHKRGTGTRFEFEADSDAYYDAIHEFQSQDLTIERVDSVDPRLEEIFVDITGQDTRTAASGHRVPDE